MPKTEYEKALAKAKRDALENSLATQIRMAGLPEPKTQFKAIPGREYAWDFYFESANLLVEVQGGTRMPKSGHNTGSGIERDTIKLALATIAGFRSIQVTGDQVRDGRAIQWIRQLVEKR